MALKRRSSGMFSPRILSILCLLVAAMAGLPSALAQSAPEWTTGSGDSARDA